MSGKKMTFDLVVVGAGAMGLAAAYEAITQGKSVLVLEAGPVAGGMAAHQDLGGLSIERYYHFICKTDYDTFGLMQELNLRDRLRWRATKMGYYSEGKLQPWGNPFALLKFSGLSLIDKFRYGLMAFYATKRSSWDRVEPLTAPEWIKAWVGERAYNKMWKPLLGLKFYGYTDAISATWIGTRIRRIGLSRRNLLEEQLGYIEGGTETLVTGLTEVILNAGGQIKCASPVSLIEKSGSLFDVHVGDNRYKAARVISTVPTPLISKMVPDLPDSIKAKYDAIPNIGVACLLFKLRKPVSENFWVNIVDDGQPVPGIIEFSNLRPTGDEHVVYVPYYMPSTEARWDWSDDELVAEAFKSIQAVNPNIDQDDVITSSVNRLRHSQPICVPNFLDMLPPIQTTLDGLQIADTSFYYPEDRGISESIKLGRNMTRQAFGLPGENYNAETAPADLT